MIKPMKFLKSAIEANIGEKKMLKKAPIFALAAHSTQMAIGATKETDLRILWMPDLFKGHVEFFVTVVENYLKGIIYL